MNKVKRFLAPILESPLFYLRSFGVFMIWWLNWVVHVLFIERLTHYLDIGNKTEFNNILLYYVIFLVIYEIAFLTTWKYSWPQIYNKTIINIQRVYINKFIKLDNNTIEWIWTWKMVAIIKWWIEIWAKLIDLLVSEIAKLIIVIFFPIYMLLKASILYTVIFIVLYVLFHLLAAVFNKKLLKLRKKRVEIKALYTKQFVKILMSKFEILQSDKIWKEVSKLDMKQEEIRKINMKMALAMNLVFRIPEWWMDIILLWVFIYFWYQVLSWNISLSVFVWISGMLIIMKRTISRSVDIYKNFTRDFEEVKRMWELFDNTPDISGYNKWKEFVYKSWDIKLEKIDFSYKKWTKKVLEKFSIDIKWWKTTAFVWNSGSGKSTIMKLIAAYIKANSWNIIVDNQNLSDVSLKSYYKNIWYLTQEASVFDWTVLDNLTYAINKDIRKEEIDKIIKLSKCEFIYELIDGINTEIWERWVKLSWWQKQRLAIAKVFLKDPKIILLDEPTSALDSFSEEQITKAMNNLFEWRTVIVIAHRLQTVKHANQIYVLEKWKIVEIWNHNSLIEKNWIYAKMLELQSAF